MHDESPWNHHLSSEARPVAVATIWISLSRPGRVVFCHGSSCFFFCVWPTCSKKKLGDIPTCSIMFHHFLRIALDNSPQMDSIWSCLGRLKPISFLNIAEPTRFLWRIFNFDLPSMVFHVFWPSDHSPGWWLDLYYSYPLYTYIYI